ncbi:hypothetical protein D910_07987 [Dendroctonus ponderosae]
MYFGPILLVLAIVSSAQYGICGENSDNEERVKRTALPQIPSVPAIPPIPQFNQADMIIKAAQEAWKIIQQIPRPP